MCFMASVVFVLITISGEDNSVLLWSTDGGLTAPQITTLTFPTPSQESRSSPQPDTSGLMLPTLTQSVSVCVHKYFILLYYLKKSLLVSNA